MLGGLKTKLLDVTVSLDGIGPVLGISLKGTQNAVRNLTNRMEEAAGDCTNLHMSYPAFVYGFWHIIRANEETDDAPLAPFALKGGRYAPEDVALLKDDVLAEPVGRYALALERLSDREDLRDHPSRYEACGLTLASCRSGHGISGVHKAFPRRDHPLEFNRMFQRLYAMYDRRFVYNAPALKGETRRGVWSEASPFLESTILKNPNFAEMKPRVG